MSVFVSSFPSPCSPSYHFFLLPYHHHHHCRQHSFILLFIILSLFIIDRIDSFCDIENKSEHWSPYIHVVDVTVGYCAVIISISTSVVNCCLWLIIAFLYGAIITIENESKHLSPSSQSRCVTWCFYCYCYCYCCCCCCWWWFTVIMLSCWC